MAAQELKEIQTITFNRLDKGHYATNIVGLMSDGRIFEFEFPDVDIPDLSFAIEKEEEHYYWTGITRNIFLNLDFGEPRLIPNEDGIYFNIMDRTPYVEMTLAEIEAKLGHKIKIKEVEKKETSVSEDFERVLEILS